MIKKTAFGLSLFSLFVLPAYLHAADTELMEKVEDEVADTRECGYVGHANNEIHDLTITLSRTSKMKIGLSVISYRDGTSFISVKRVFDRNGIPSDESLHNYSISKDATKLQISGTSMNRSGSSQLHVASSSVAAYDQGILDKILKTSADQWGLPIGTDRYAVYNAVVCAKEILSVIAKPKAAST